MKHVTARGGRNKCFFCIYLSLGANIVLKSIWNAQQQQRKSKMFLVIASVKSSLIIAKEKCRFEIDTKFKYSSDRVASLRLQSVFAS